MFEKPPELKPLEPLKPIKLPSVGLKPPRPNPPPQLRIDAPKKVLKDGKVNTSLVMPQGIHDKSKIPEASNENNSYDEYSPMATSPKRSKYQSSHK